MNKTCGSCGTSRSTNQFYKLPNGEYSHICKVCVNKQVKEYYEQLDSYSAALWLVLAKLNVPFFQEQWKDVEAMIVASGSNRKPDLVLNYLRSLAESGKIVHGFWESDTMLDQIIDTVVDRDKEVEEEMDWPLLTRRWGKFTDKNGQIDKEAYYYLEAKMEEYTGNLSITRPAQINRYRDLCKAELRKIRLEEDPNATQKDISAATGEILTLMKLLKIDNFQSDSRTDVEKTLEYQMALMEKTKPCEDEDINKYRDFCGFYNLEQSLMRPLRNLVAGTKDYPSLTKE